MEGKRADIYVHKHWKCFPEKKKSFAFAILSGNLQRLFTLIEMLHSILRLRVVILPLLFAPDDQKRLL